MKTQYKELFPGTPEYEALQGFAETFNHRIVPRVGFRTHAFMREGKVFGYSEITTLPVAFPAFHPEFSSPRAVMEVLDTWRILGEVNSLGSSIISVPTEEIRQTFPRSLLESHGMQRMERELYIREGGT